MADEGAKSPGKFGTELWVRLASALALALVALTALWWGGAVFAGLVAAACGLILHEWIGMSGPYAQRMAPKAAIAFTVVTVYLAQGAPVDGLLLTGAVALVVLIASVTDARLRWLAAGIVYAVLPGIAAVALRGDGAMAGGASGFMATVFVFAVVWATDTAAYFSGRLIGGPKLAPRFSPKKTWSGAIGGAVAAVAAGLVAARIAGLGNLLPLAVLALALSAVSQAGDIAESAMKRHFGVKDSSHLIPGHGGIMDRVDGLVFALVLAAAVGLVRGADSAAAGLLFW